MDRSENRDMFEQALTEPNIPQPKRETALSVEEAVEVADEIGYPILVRPSYVLVEGQWRSWMIRRDLLHYMKNAVKINPKHPVLIDRYLTGKEIEVDAISDGETVVIPGIMEHIDVLKSFWRFYSSLPSTESIRKYERKNYRLYD